MTPTEPDRCPGPSCRKEPIGCRFCDDLICWECVTHDVRFPVCVGWTKQSLLVEYSRILRERWKAGVEVAGLEIPGFKRACRIVGITEAEFLELEREHAFCEAHKAHACCGVACPVCSIIQCPSCGREREKVGFCNATCERIYAKRKLPAPSGR